MVEINTKELINFLEQKNAKIIDIRPIDEFNGWLSPNTARGGHIPRAIALPVKWANYIDWIEIIRAKQIMPEDNLVIYGTNAEEINKIAHLFEKAGYSNLFTYSQFESEWLTNGNLPLEKLARYKHLVSPQWVNELISGGKPAEYENDKFVVVHAHYRNRDAYLSGHIPGAIDMDTLALEAPETWNRRSPEELKEALEKHGITADTTVVLYGKFLHPDNADDYPGSAAGHIGAIRLFMIMLYAGVKDLRVLNGGFQSWKDAGFEISKIDVTKQAVSDFGVKIPARPEIIVDVDEAKEMIKSDEAELVCVRSWPEYIGEVSGYNYIEKKGRIPGAIFANCGTDAYHMENYRNLDHTTRQASETELFWTENNITADKHLAFYCGTGWRGSEAFFNAWLMGWPRVSVFDGGWFEWSNDPANPYETGIPQD